MRAKPGGPPARRLIVNADDYGYGAAFDRGILEAAAAGAITSTTVLIGRGPGDRAILAYPSVSVGLHLELNPAGSPAAQVADQIGRFAVWAGRLPSHLDSHHHRHAEPWAIEAVISAARRHALPVRSVGATDRARLQAAGIRTPDDCFGRDDPDEPDLAGWVDRALGALPSARASGMSTPATPTQAILPATMPRAPRTWPCSARTGCAPAWPINASHSCRMQPSAISVTSRRLGANGRRSPRSPGCARAPSSAGC
ncbi:MAG TPA: ChbG/HpnK family deacetylase [Dehalococcoidia bacterium]|nr:ChbG/HpnK family deacetylase [Dehalococcoidia bacterium]